MLNVKLVSGPQTQYHQQYAVCLQCSFLSDLKDLILAASSVSVSFTPRGWLTYRINRAENTSLTVSFCKFRNISEVWSSRFLSQSFTGLGRHCKRNLMNLPLLQLRPVYFKPQPLTCLLRNVGKLQSSKQFEQSLHELPDLISSRGGNGMFSFSNSAFCTMISFICAAIREGTLSSLSKRGCFFPVPVLTSDG